MRSITVYNRINNRIKRRRQSPLKRLKEGLRTKKGLTKVHPKSRQREELYADVNCKKSVDEISVFEIQNYTYLSV